MQNAVFNIEFNKENGTVSEIWLNGDACSMNWVSENGMWGYIHCINYDGLWGDYKSRQREMKLVSFSESEDSAVSVYSNEAVQLTVVRGFDVSGNFTESFTFKNLMYADAFLSEYNCGIEVPFNDVYTNADDCLAHRCNTHIWCGLESTYINALRMGVSNLNIGLAVTRGSFENYSVIDCGGNKRGRFVLNPSHFELSENEEYTIEWTLFPHGGKSDFVNKSLQTPQYIHIDAKHHTLLGGERIIFSARAGKAAKDVRVYTKHGDIDFVIEDGEVKVDYLPEKNGEYKIYVEINGVRTYTEFVVKNSFEEILKKRIDFIVHRQQFNKPGSALDGAFLIYDNREEHVIFENCIGDHNASRERIGMGLLIARYLQTHENSEYRAALDKYIKFIQREIFDADSGCVYNTVDQL